LLGDFSTVRKSVRILLLPVDTSDVRVRHVEPEDDGRIERKKKPSGISSLHLDKASLNWRYSDRSAQVFVQGKLTTRVDVFVRGADDALLHRYFKQDWWSPWESLGGSIISAPAVALWAPDRLYVFARGKDNALWWLSHDAGGWSSVWLSLGGSITSDPAAVSWADGRIDVFVVGANNALYHQDHDGSGTFRGSPESRCEKRRSSQQKGRGEKGAGESSEAQRGD
jgi:hypothetical protein